MSGVIQDDREKSDTETTFPQARLSNQPSSQKCPLFRLPEYFFLFVLVQKLLGLQLELS